MQTGTPYAAYKCPENHYCSTAATAARSPAGAITRRQVRCRECRTPAGSGMQYTLSRSRGTAVSGGFANGRGGWWQLFEGEGAELAASAAAAAPGAGAAAAAAAAAAASSAINRGCQIQTHHAVRSPRTSRLPAKLELGYQRR